MDQIVQEGRSSKLQLEFRETGKWPGKSDGEFDLYGERPVSRLIFHERHSPSSHIDSHGRVLPRCLFLYAAGAHDDGCLLEPVLRGSEYLSDRSAPPGSLKVALTLLEACKRIIVTGGNKRSNVRYWHKADIPAYAASCPLLGVKRTLWGCVLNVCL
jgi:hypothetical protein